MRQTSRCKREEQCLEGEEEKLGAFPEPLTLAPGPRQQRPCVKLAVLIWPSRWRRQRRCSGHSRPTGLNRAPGESASPTDPNHPGEQKAFAARGQPRALQTDPRTDEQRALRNTLTVSTTQFADASRCGFSSRPSESHGSNSQVSQRMTHEYGKGLWLLS